MTEGSLRGSTERGKLKNVNNGKRHPPFFVIACFSVSYSLLTETAISRNLMSGSLNKFGSYFEDLAQFQLSSVIRSTFLQSKSNKSLNGEFRSLMSTQELRTLLFMNLKMSKVHSLLCTLITSVIKFSPRHQHHRVTTTRTHTSSDRSYCL